MFDEVSGKRLLGTVLFCFHAVSFASGTRLLENPSKNLASFFAYLQNSDDPALALQPTTDEKRSCSGVFISDNVALTTVTCLLKILDLTWNSDLAAVQAKPLYITSTSLFGRPSGTTGSAFRSATWVPHHSFRKSSPNLYNTALVKLEDDTNSSGRVGSLLRKIGNAGKQATKGITLKYPEICNHTENSEIHGRLMGKKGVATSGFEPYLLEYLFKKDDNFWYPAEPESSDQDNYADLSHQTDDGSTVFEKLSNREFCVFALSAYKKQRDEALFYNMAFNELTASIKSWVDENVGVKEKWMYKDGGSLSRIPDSVFGGLLGRSRHNGR